MSRLQALRQIIDRAIARSEVADDMDPDLMIDVVYGVLWYRLLLDHARTAPPAVMVVRAGPIPRQAPGGGARDGRPDRSAAGTAYRRHRWAGAVACRPRPAAAAAGDRPGRSAAVGSRSARPTVRRPDAVPVRAEPPPARPSGRGPRSRRRREVRQ
ncbi:TetR-like C-terminal domain-containing protein [Nocardia africana]|uniref:TetR-like C-terminal domain-containing protein n=1 Tax=Nocardia africana TaxID=134964 RepID=UPI001C68EB9F